MPKYTSLDEVPQHMKDSLRAYVTNLEGDTFVLTNLPHEVTGGVLARYSRAPTGLRLTLVNEFLDEEGKPVRAKGTALLDRVLVQYGDDSVGELEGVHVGIENISQIGTKWFEDRRIGGSPIEQSTRYVKYDQKDKDGKWRYLRPQEIKEAGLLERFEQANDRAFEVYSEGIKRLTDHFKSTFPREHFKIPVVRNGDTITVGTDEVQGDEERREFNNAYTHTVRCAALDVGRCVLPATTLTHVGLFGNGRYFTNILSFLKSQPYAEAQERGKSLEEELKKVIPTFIKRNRADRKIRERDNNMRQIAKALFSLTQPEVNGVTLVPRAEYLDETVALTLFPYTNISLQQIQELIIQYVGNETKESIVQQYIGKRESRRDRSGRSLEAGYPITFDLVGTFAEYRDLERHRMVTQQRQQLTPDLGFVMPPEMREIGLEEQVKEVITRIEDLHNDIKHAGLRHIAEYATLFNYRVRWVMGMNLRELQHLAELRTQPAGHFGYRAMAMEMAKKVIQRDPWIARTEALKFVDYTDPDNKITRAKEQSRIAGKNIAKGIEGSIDLV